MAAVFPGGVKTYAAVSAGQELPFDLIQSFQDEITAIETTVGTTSTASISFTPTIVSSGGGTPTYSVQVGRYQRQSAEVSLWGHITLASFGSLAAGTIFIGGLPLAATNVTNLYGNVTFSYWSGMTTAVVDIKGYIPAASTLMFPLIVTAATTSMISNSLTKADLGATVDLIFSATYLVA